MRRSRLNRLVFLSSLLAAVIVYPVSLPARAEEKAEGPTCHLTGKSDVPNPVAIEKAIKEKVEFVTRHAYLMLAQGQVPDPQNCTADESWMCAGPEHACSRDGHKVEGDDTVNWHACGCHHTCKEDPKPNDPTQGRKWDNKCKTRCSPSHCHCGPRHCLET